MDRGSRDFSKTMNVKAFIGTQIAHVSQIFTGLAMLKSIGKIEIKFERDSEVRSSDAIQRIEVNGKKLIFDLADGFHYNKIFYEWCDLYFKRMLSPQMGIQFPKMRPYGLNYGVYGVGDKLILRSMITRDYKFLLKNLGRRSSFLSKIFNPNLSYRSSLVRHFEAQPSLNEELRIIYFTRLWNPANVKNDIKKEQRESMNELRRDLVKRLRKEFGRQFVGGIMYSDFAAKYAPNETISNNAFLHKSNYLENLRRSDIGIADYGLEFSVGWKLAEYVAMSKAIITTPINTLLPGHFSEGDNYLSYSTIEEGLSNCEQLLADREQTLSIQKQNSLYYKDYLSPDVLIYNCLTCDE